MNNLSKEYSQLQISIANPKEIKNSSKGAIKNSRTLNYRTKKPEIGGLFCPKIFGEENDYTCGCGSLKGIQNKHKICSQCGLKPTHGYNRRSFMGHIDLVCPVVHPWFKNKKLPYLMSLLGFDSVVSIQKNLVTNHIELHEIRDYLDREINSIADINQIARSILEDEDNPSQVELLESILSSTDLSSDYIHIRNDIIKKKEGKDSFFSSLTMKKKVQRYKIIESYLQHSRRPEWIIMHAIPVLPPDLRPILLLKDNVLISSDLNTLYRIIINRNKRLQLLISRYKNSSMIDLEKKMLQISVNQLFENERIKPPVVNRKKEPLVSLSKRLGGKKGRFRYNLLGKRINYSGRSVITVNPKLQLSQCGLPLAMVLTLFRPFLAYKLKDIISQNKVRLDKSYDIRLVFPMIIRFVTEIIKDHPILLNRAPTLHRMNIQAFEPIIVNGKAIQLHPLVCSSFNADFDGDQMAVHLPISMESQLEARSLMMSTNNVLGPANGNPIISPSQDIVLGLHYLTQSYGIDDGSKILNISNAKEFNRMLSSNLLQVHDLISIPFLKKQGIEWTTVGRYLLYDIIPTSSKISYNSINQVFNKSLISNLVKTVKLNSNKESFLKFADKLMSLGFYNAFRLGMSLNKNDITTSTNKENLIDYNKKEAELQECQKSFDLYNDFECSNRGIQLWNNCLSDLSNDLIEDIINVDVLSKPTLYLSLRSGAKGSPIQIRQLACMRGHMVKTTGEVVEQPILSNLHEGLSTLEYYYSAHGSRKGVIDTSLKTAVAGYFTRKLFSASQDHVITEHDCGTVHGISIQSLLEDSSIDTDLQEYFRDRIYGRTLSTDVVDLDTSKIILPKGSVILEPELRILKEYSVEQVTVRSLLTCESLEGSCQKCYGISFNDRSYPQIGDPIGIIAAQSIGEPGTQLTMRTFHIGGALQAGNNEAFVQSSIEGYAYILHRSYVKNRYEERITTSNSNTLLIVDKNNATRYEYPLPLGSKIFISDGESIKKGQVLARWNSAKETFIATSPGTIKIIHFKEKKIGFVISKQVPFRVLQQFDILNQDILNVSNGQTVHTGDSLLLRPKGGNQSKDITNDLALVSQILEMVKEKNDMAIVSPISGRVKFYESNDRSSCTVEITNSHKKWRKKVFCAIQDLNVKNLDYVKKGTILKEGNVNPLGLLSSKGIRDFINYFIPKIYFLYLGQGAKLNDKHIELVFKQLLNRVTIRTKENMTGDQQLDLIPMEIVPKNFLYRKNIKALAGYSTSNYGELEVYGLSQIASTQSSFLSAAAFQRTSKVLTESALLNKKDSFNTPMSTTTIGTLMPVGTGYKNSINNPSS